MSNINDFKIIGKKCLRYFDLLQSLVGDKKIKKVSDRERMGFYLFFLEYVTGIKDISNLLDLITDSDFNLRILGENFEDLGIDAVSFNKEENIIQLFNFKYRNKFSSGKSKINEAIISTKFINAISTRNTKGLGGKVLLKAKKIIEKLDSKDEWRLQLYLVSNENSEAEQSNNLDRLNELYGLEVINVGLNEVSQIMSLSPKSADAELILDSDAVISFTEDPISSNKSYVIKLPLHELIRITSDDKFLRVNSNVEIFSQLSGVGLDFSMLFDNVRGFIIKSKYNNNILTTLQNEPTKFFIYNNGLTLTANDIEVKQINGNSKFKIKLKSLQVLNGGQTLRTIHLFNQKDEKNIENNLTKAQILVRIFKISSDSDLNNKIAEFTNSQNAISNIDLKSLRVEQLQLEQYLSEHEIIYVRKSGDTGLTNDKSYKYRISMEKFGQILFSIQGFPEKATNQKKNIFDKHYNSIFVTQFKIENSPMYIEKYFLTKKEYEKIQNNVSDQKIFYIMYICEKIKKSKVEDVIQKFEKKIKEYIPLTDSNLSDSRKLIQKNFKEFIDKEFSILN